jgi:hypothetical protein
VWQVQGIGNEELPPCQPERDFADPDNHVHLSHSHTACIWRG